MPEKIVNQPNLRNQEPISSALGPWLVNPGKLLELASGTGQHGVYISQQLPHIHWQLSEHPDNLALSQPWWEDAQLSNLHQAIALDVSLPNWPCDHHSYQYGFCSNLFHFISRHHVQSIFQGMTMALDNKGLFFCYGPINENGFTSVGNAELDAWLKRDIHPQAGIKELADLVMMAEQAGMQLKHRENLPANNVILIFDKR